MDYKKIIKSNEDDFKDPEQLKDFLDGYLCNDKTLSDLDDDLHEFADGLVPIYYVDIITEWQSNPNCHGDGKDQGLIEGEQDPHKIMQADLYTMYYGEISEDYQTLVNLVDDLED